MPVKNKLWSNPITRTVYKARERKNLRNAMKLQMSFCDTHNLNALTGLHFSGRHERTLAAGVLVGAIMVLRVVSELPLRIIGPAQRCQLGSCKSFEPLTEGPSWRDAMVTAMARIVTTRLVRGGSERSGFHHILGVQPSPGLSFFAGIVDRLARFRSKPVFGGPCWPFCSSLISRAQLRNSITAHPKQRL